MVDSATSVTETYTWNADGTLASSPGPSYTRNYGYDEEGRLLSIAHGSTVAFQYGYAYDGGRRWRKDIVNSVWTWYPCGVACSAGELVEQTSDLTGNTWTNSATFLRGSSCSGGLIRRNSEYHHEDILGAFPVITNGSGTVLSNNLYDSFGVQRFTSGTVSTQYRSSAGYNEAEGLMGVCWVQAERDLSLTLDCQSHRGPGTSIPTNPSTGCAKHSSGFAKCMTCCENNYNKDQKICESKYKECLRRAKTDSDRKACLMSKNICTIPSEAILGWCSYWCSRRFPQPPILSSNAS